MPEAEIHLRGLPGLGVLRGRRAFPAWGFCPGSGADGAEA
jgi:hypothetical protein